jgi:hypothetical protein
VSGAQFAPPEGGGAVLSIPMTYIPQGSRWGDPPKPPAQG